MDVQGLPRDGGGQVTNLSLVERAGRLEVTDKDTADLAGRLLMEVKSAIKAIDDERLGVTRNLDKAKSDLIAMANRQKQPFLDAEEHLKGLLLVFNEQEALRVEEERAALEQRQADLEAASLRAMEEGRMSDAVEAMEERDEFVPEPRAYRAPGTQVRETWKAEVTDIDALIEAAEREPSLRVFLVANESRLGAFARARKERASLPGVRFYSEKSVAAGRA